MTRHKSIVLTRISRFGLRELVLVLPVIAAFAILNARPRFPDYEPILETRTVSVDAGLGEHTQYGWPLTFIDIHYSIRPTLTFEFYDLGLAQYQFLWLSLLLNMLVWMAATIAIYLVSYLVSGKAHAGSG